MTVASASTVSPDSNIRPQDELPPKLSDGKEQLKFIAWLLALSGGGYLLFLCFDYLSGVNATPECSCWTYMALAATLAGVCLREWLIFGIRQHEARLVDRSEVEALMDDARRILELAKDLPTKQTKHLERLLRGLEENFDPATWTEFRVLPLEQAIVDQMDVKELSSKAWSRFQDLTEYNERRSSDESEFFNRQETLIEDAIKDLKEDKTKENAEAKLRAELKTLLETKAGYDMNWAMGTAIHFGLMICSLFAIPIFIIGGILPFLETEPDKLSVVHWGFLGIGGAVTSALLNLYRSSSVDIGLNEGMDVLKRSAQGSALGFVSGTILYWLLIGKLISPGGMFPELKSELTKDIGLTIFWAFAAGFYFEGVFLRAKKFASTAFDN